MSYQPGHTRQHTQLRLKGRKLLPAQPLQHHKGRIYRHSKRYCCVLNRCTTQSTLEARARTCCNWLFMVIYTVSLLVSYHVCRACLSGSCGLWHRLLLRHHVWVNCHLVKHLAVRERLGLLLAHESRPLVVLLLFTMSLLSIYRPLGARQKPMRTDLNI